jgi:hypothetical protein
LAADASSGDDLADKLRRTLAKSEAKEKILAGVKKDGVVPEETTLLGPGLIFGKMSKHTTDGQAATVRSKSPPGARAAFKAPGVYSQEIVVLENWRAE